MNLIPINKLKDGSININIAANGSSLINKAYVGSSLSLVRFSEYPRLKVDVESVEFGMNGGSSAVTVTSNTTWSASTSSSWLMIVTGSTGFTVTADENVVEEVRSGVITVTAWNVDASITSSITVSQAAYADIVYLDYIETVRGCFYDTGIYATINTKVEMDLVPLFGYSSECYIGSQEAVGNDSHSFFITRNGGSRSSLTGRIGNVSVSTSLGTSDIYHVSLDNKSLRCGNNYSVTYPTTFSDSVCTLYINQKHIQTGTIDLSGSARYYRIKIYEDGVLVADLRPASFQGLLGFYDDVNQIFRENLGTGTATAGTI